MDMNSQPSSRTMMLREIREHGAALAYPVQEHMGAAGPNGVVGSCARWY